MCLGIPMQIKEIEGFIARCEAKGVSRDVNLFMLQHEALKPEDYVVVHVGYAIQKITPQDVTLEDVFVAKTGRTLAEDTALKPGGGEQNVRRH